MSLFQPESLLCPSLFLKQNHDSSFDIAKPYYLHGDIIAKAKLRFASFYNVYCRINNLELAVSANVKHLYYLVDALLNINLHKSLTCKYFKRGIQNIEVKGEKINKSIVQSNTISITDSEKNVKELARAITYKGPSVFLTITLNMTKHPGTATLIRTIGTLFLDKTLEEYKAAMQTFMPVIMRIWNLTVQVLLNYLIKSPAHLLGNIDYWGRVEFQKNSGNSLPFSTVAERFNE